MSTSDRQVDSAVYGSKRLRPSETRRSSMNRRRLERLGSSSHPRTLTNARPQQPPALHLPQKRPGHHWPPAQHQQGLRQVDRPAQRGLPQRPAAEHSVPLRSRLALHAVDRCPSLRHKALQLVPQSTLGCGLQDRHQWLQAVRCQLAFLRARPAARWIARPAHQLRSLAAHPTHSWALVQRSTARSVRAHRSHWPQP